MVACYLCSYWCSDSSQWFPAVFLKKKSILLCPPFCSELLHYKKNTSKVKVCLYLTAETACNVCFLTVFQIVLTYWPYQSPSAVVIPQIVVPNDFTFSFIKFWWWNIFHTLTLSNKTKSVARLWKNFLANKTHGAQQAKTRTENNIGGVCAQEVRLRMHTTRIFQAKIQDVLV